ncbi:MAG: malonyl-ACP O-methyltransferase BioC [Mariprofundus sp.]|nr:malonyl-ACP O-methyltransferase BioC [Mariprofundus sp.]
MNSSHIHTQQVSRSFSAASNSYDSHAVLQREIADRLLTHLDFIKIEPQHILDIGCGTGYFTRLLRGRYKKATLVAFDLSESMLQHTRSAHALRMPWHGKHHHAAGDATRLPFKTGSFNLVCSNLAMQWVSDPQRMLAEMRRVLAPGGLMLFSTFGRRTLSELRQTLASIEPERAGHVLPFPDVTSLGDELLKLAVELPVTDSDLFTLTYPNVLALIRELKGLGASASAIRGRKAGLYGRALIRELEQRYPQSFQAEDNKFSATFEALYGQAWYKESGFEHTDSMIPIHPA